jgi:putative ABC transport system permease protein
VTGLDRNGVLRRVVRGNGDVMTLPPQGLVISTALSKLLEVHRGDTLRIEVLDGKRQTRDVLVADTVAEWMGINAYMSRDALHALLGEPRMATAAYLLAESGERETLYRQLKAYPGVAGVAISDAMLQAFNDTIAENMLGMMVILSGFAGVIAFGVVYNTARITLAERARELATMRVIGLTQTEVSIVLLGEIAILTLIAIPLGWLIGTGAAHGLSIAVETKIFRFPAIVDPQTYVVAALVVAGSALFSGWIVRRRIRDLDLVSVLKTRE